MTALILLAHGSRHPDTVRVLEALAADVRRHLPDGSANGPTHVELAWLDLVQPSLNRVCDSLAQQGVRQAVAVPLLFTEAFHAQVDIPQQIADCAQHGISITVTEGLGLGDGTRRAILRRIVEATKEFVPGTMADVVIMGVGSSNERANRAVHFFAEQLDAQLPGHVSASFVVGPEQIKGAEAVSIAARKAELRGRQLVAIPLFTAPGLLWDKVRREAEGLAIFGKPLETLLTPIVCCRWDSIALNRAA